MSEESTAKLRKKIADIREADMRVSDWESEFLDNVEARLEGDRALTAAQEEKLLQIWGRVP